MNTSTRTKILIADDQADVVYSLYLLLKGEGYATESANSPGQVLEVVRRDEFDALLIDLNYTRDTTSGREGMELLRCLQDFDPALPVIVMTAWGTVELAVEAMQRGTSDFVLKPWENSHLLNVLRTQVARRRVLRKRQRLEAGKRELAAIVAGTGESVEFLSAAAENIRGALAAPSVSVWMANAGQRDHSLAACSGEGPACDPAFRASLPTLRRDESVLDLRPGAAPPGSRSAALRDLGIALLAPFWQAGEMSGFIGVTERTPAEDYQSDERDYLAVATGQIAAALDLREARGHAWEVEEVREIQRAMLPGTFPDIPGFSIHGSWRAAGNVGGDYFHVADLGNGLFGICVADVVGKGIPAAMLLSNLQGAIRAVSAGAREPAGVCAALNASLAGNIPSGKFITCFYGILDTTSGRFCFTNAGHNPPVLLRDGGAAERLDTENPVLGIFGNASFTQQQVELRHGDRLVLFTDGITEIRNAAGEEFGEQRLIEEAVALRGAAPAALHERLLAHATEFGAGQFLDDATLIVLSKLHAGVPAANLDYQAGR